MSTFEGEARPAGSVEVRRYTAAEMAEREAAAARLAALTGGEPVLWATARQQGATLTVNVCALVPWFGQATETVQVAVPDDDPAVAVIGAALDDLLARHGADVTFTVRLAAARTLLRAMDRGEIVR